jgi:hypothetical protein
VISSITVAAMPVAALVDWFSLVARMTCANIRLISASISSVIAIATRSSTRETPLSLPSRTIRARTRPRFTLRASGRV